MAINRILCIVILLSLIIHGVCAAEQLHPVTDSDLERSSYVGYIEENWSQYVLHRNNAEAYGKQKDYTNALIEYKAAYKIFPQDWIFYNMARINHLIKRYEEAVKYYDFYIESAEQGRIRPEKEQLMQAKSYRQEAWLSLQLPLPAYKRKWFAPVIGTIAALVATGVSVAVVATQPQPPEQAVFRQAALRF